MAIMVISFGRRPSSPFDDRFFNVGIGMNLPILQSTFEGKPPSGSPVPSSRFLDPLCFECVAGPFLHPPPPPFALNNRKPIDAVRDGELLHVRPISKQPKC